MGIGIARLTNLSWLMISDRQVFAIRSLLQPKAAQAEEANEAHGSDRKRVPALSWPSNLFKDCNPDA